MIRRLLVANRAEIARRVFTTCRALGIETVAIFSDADAHAPHVREADQAVHLPGNAAADTYLRGDLIIDAARRAGADAIHPGYGFLAESAEFAAAVIDAGIVWIGPSPKAILAMGSKVEAKALLREAGVPMLPSWTEPGQVTDFPVLVKASAGGGGRGMRVVRSADALAEAMASASREAAAAFGDGAVFCERYVERGRHIEVQIFGDSFGTIVALGERECSIQRRHQKIVEESPSPALTDAARAEICAAAVAAARAVDYVGAGTVEFLLAPDGTFAFLEMNTRLQVEHPVTECVTGLDLVELQLLVAQGRPLPFTQPPAPRGHAIEVRLYAEDPTRDWLASTGTLHRFAVPGCRSTFTVAPAGSGVRLDSGVADGVEVSPFYDPMLAKVIAWAPSRTDAARLLATSLAHAQVHGVRTNRDLLTSVLRSKAFLDGDTDTSFLSSHPELLAEPLTRDDQALASLATALADASGRRASAPWSPLPAGWRNVASGPQSRAYTLDAQNIAITVTYRQDRDGCLTSWSVTDSDGQPFVSVSDVDMVECASASPTEVVLMVGPRRLTYQIHQVRDVSYVDFVAGSLTLTEIPRFPLAERSLPVGSLVAPMPAAVGRVLVKVDDAVTAGELLMTLEAMKLEHPVYAPQAGTIAELSVHTGDQVEAGAVLAIISPTESRPSPSEDVA